MNFFLSLQAISIWSFLHLRISKLTTATSVEAEMITKTYDCVDLPPLDLAEEKLICFGCVSRPSQSLRISSNLCLRAFFPSWESKLNENSYGDQWTDLDTSDLQKLSLAFVTLSDQSLEWLLEIGVTIRYQIFLAQHQIAMSLCGPPSSLKLPVLARLCRSLQYTCSRLFVPTRT